MDMGFPTAVGLFKNVINFALIMTANAIARRAGHDGITGGDEVADATHKSSLDIKVQKESHSQVSIGDAILIIIMSLLSLSVILPFITLFWYQWYPKQFMLDHLYFCGLKRLFGTTIGLF